jgi:DNA-binding NtrC family response regulator
MSTFAYAGVSKLDGKFKVRFANDQLRTKVLVKNGHTDIDIVPLKNPMSKEDAVKFLLSIDFDNGNKAVRAALEAELGKREPTAKAVVKRAAPKAKAKAKPTMDAIKAKVAKVAKATAPVESEDAPF